MRTAKVCGQSIEEILKAVRWEIALYELRTCCADKQFQVLADFALVHIHLSFDQPLSVLA